MYLYSGGWSTLSVIIGLCHLELKPNASFKIQDEVYGFQLEVN